MPVLLAACRLLRAACLGLGAAVLLSLRSAHDAPALIQRITWLAGAVLVAAVTTLFIRHRDGSHQAIRAAIDPTPAVVDAANREHRIALATVTGLSTARTDGGPNDAPVIVAPHDRAPYRTRLRYTLRTRTAVASGSVVAVMRVLPDRPEVVLLPYEDLPPTWQWQVDQDIRRVREITAAPEWKPPARSWSQGRVPIAVLAAVGVLACVAGVLLGPWPAAAPHSSAPGTPPSAASTGTDEADVLSADRLPDIVQDLADTLGHDRVTHLHATSSGDVSVDAPARPDGTTTDEYTWSRGTVEHGRASIRQPEPADLPGMLFELTGVDWTVTEALTARATTLTGITDPDWIGVGVQRADLGPDRDTGATRYGAVVFTVDVSDAYRDGSVRFDASGEVLTMSGGVPGSAAAEGIDLLDPEHAPGVVEDLLAATGAPQVTELGLSRSSGNATMRTAPEALTVDEYDWRDGFARRRGAAPIQPAPEELAGKEFDPHQVDWAVVGSLATQASELTGITDPDGPRVTVARTHSYDPGLHQDRYGDPQIQVFLSDEYWSGVVTFDTAGQVVSMRDGAPGSAAEAWQAAH